MDKSIYHSLKSQAMIRNGIHAIKAKTNTATFSTQLEQSITSLDKLNISKHANERIKQRGIIIDEAKWKQIEMKVNQAKQMGVTDSLVLVNDADAALIISAKNNTVITAMNSQEAQKQIFTNINGTIIMN